MLINLAYLSIEGSRVAIFEAAPMIDNKAMRAGLLDRLTRRLIREGSEVDLSALAYVPRIADKYVYHGDQDLVNYLVRNGHPEWTNRMDI